jgi:hypothetical protein
MFSALNGDGSGNCGWSGACGACHCCCRSLVWGGLVVWYRHWVVALLL